MKNNKTLRTNSMKLKGNSHFLAISAFTFTSINSSLIRQYKHKTGIFFTTDNTNTMLRNRYYNRNGAQTGGQTGWPLQQENQLFALITRYVGQSLS